MCNVCPPTAPYLPPPAEQTSYFVIMNWNGTILKDKHGKLAQYNNSWDAEGRITEEMTAGKIGEYIIFRSFAAAKPTANFSTKYHY